MWFFRTHEEIKTSHENPVGVALYNYVFESVVSCDDGGFVSVWDIENGKLVSKFGNTHGGKKITAASFDGYVNEDGEDDGCRRLITAGADGNIKIWNFSNG